MGLPSDTGSISALSPLLLDPLVHTLGKYFASQGVEAYLVGGAIRDALLGRPTNDVDLAVAGDARPIGSRLASMLRGRLVPLDEARQIVRVVVPGPEGASFLDLKSLGNGILDDLRQRDFTVDAMALPLAGEPSGWSQGMVVDPFGGMQDLRAGVIRCVALSVFRADPARLLRGPRLAAQLGFDIDVDTERQIRNDAHLVATVAAERVRDEFLKLLAQPDATASLRKLDGLGLLGQVIPELEEARGVSQPKEHYWDVFYHMVETPGQVERVALEKRPGEGFAEDMVPRFDAMREHFGEEFSDGHTRLTLVKLAGLLHDIAKPATRTVEPSGRIRFLDHHTQGAETSARALKRLRLSRRGVEHVRLMVQHHLRPGQLAHRDELPTPRAVYRYYRDVGGAAIDTLYLNMADYLAARGQNLGRQEWSERCRVIEHILTRGGEQQAPESLPKLVTGHDIMDSLSLDPGPRIGELLDIVSEAQATGEVSTHEEALQLVKANLDSGGVRA